MQLGDFGSHLCTELCIQVGKRFVQQEDLRIPDDCTTQCNTLSLTTGHCLRLSVQQVAQVEDCSSFFYLLCDFSLRYFSQLQTECHVIEYGHVRIQRVVLENHCDVTILRSDVVYQTVTDVQFALGDFFQTSDHSQCGGLSAAGRTYQNDKFLILNFQIYIFNSFYIARIYLVNASQ